MTRSRRGQHNLVLTHFEQSKPRARRTVPRGLRSEPSQEIILVMKLYMQMTREAGQLRQKALGLALILLKSICIIGQSQALQANCFFFNSMMRQTTHSFVVINRLSHICNRPS